MGNKPTREEIYTEIRSLRFEYIEDVLHDLEDKYPYIKKYEEYKVAYQLGMQISKFVNQLHWDKYSMQELIDHRDSTDKAVKDVMYKLLTKILWCKWAIEKDEYMDRGKQIAKSNTSDSSDWSMRADGIKTQTNWGNYN